jgi:biopolymer transport protein ExbB/TolQ
MLARADANLETIAGLAPIMGLFGTVVGMIEIFGAQSTALGRLYFSGDGLAADYAQAWFKNLAEAGDRRRSTF